MFINKEGKLFGKISIIDIAIVLIIALLAVGAYMKLVPDTETKVETQSQKIEYTILTKGVRMGTVEALQKLGPIYNTSTNEYAGEIVEVTFTDSVETKSFPDGTLKPVTVPEKYNVTVKVQTDGSVSDSGFFTSTKQSINVGSTLYYASKYSTTSGTIMSVGEAK